ncbi:hypothetical protein [Williamsia sp.]|uniref:hypothetical protein n=1 Tax=Williamsia sp. TaxID=1872085 RepID=UPI002F934E88
MGDWYYNISTGEVNESMPRGFDRMGPYPTEDAARHALDLAKQRNEAADRYDEE